MAPVKAQVLCLVVVVLALSVTARAQGAVPPPAVLGDTHSGGAEIATQFTKATGVAITPLLGMSFLGATKWFSTPEELRSKLPWYDQPYFWGTGLAIIAVLWFGHRLPVIKRGFKFIKVWESKASAVVAIPAVGQSIVAALPNLPSSPATAWFSPIHWIIPTAHASEASTAAAHAAGTAGTVVAASVCLVGGALVWLMFHTINVLVLVSPIGVVDWILKAFRVGAVAVLLLAIAISPWLGALVSAFYLLLALIIAGWAFRLMIFGAVFSGDFALLRWRRQKIDTDGIEAFSDSGLSTIPVRTWGRLHLDGAGVVFRFRPFMVLPKKEVRIDAPLFIGRGLLSPLLVSGTLAGGGEESALARFPPRYRGHAAALVTALEASGERDVGLQRGVKAAFAWIKVQLRFKSKTPIGLQAVR